MKTSNLKNSNLLFFLLGGVVLIFFLISAYLLISTGTLFTNNEPAFVSESGYHEAHEPEKGEERARLETVLPYRGTNVTVVLNDELAKYQVYYNPSNRSAGESELRQFLADNGLGFEDFEAYYVESSSPL
jgi:hypothetical protein